MFVKNFLKIFFVGLNFRYDVSVIKKVRVLFCLKESWEAG